MNILLGVTGSVATTIAHKLYKALRDEGHNVKMVATTPAMYFLDEEFMRWHYVYEDKTEWPINGYHKKDPVKHIEFRDWADVLLIAPMTANTLAKIANGISDNFLCCIARAWPKQKPLILAPAMNTEMWIDPITRKQLLSLRERFRVSVVSPVAKELACGDIGIGAMAEIDTIIKVVKEI